MRRSFTDKKFIAGVYFDFFHDSAKYYDCGNNYRSRNGKTFRIKNFIYCACDLRGTFILDKRGCGVNFFRAES